MTDWRAYLLLHGPSLLEVDDADEVRVRPHHAHDIDLVGVEVLHLAGSRPEQGVGLAGSALVGDVPRIVVLAGVAGGGLQAVALPAGLAGDLLDPAAARERGDRGLGGGGELGLGSSPQGIHVVLGVVHAHQQTVVHDPHGVQEVGVLADLLEQLHGGVRREANFVLDVVVLEDHIGRMLAAHRVRTPAQEKRKRN